MLEDVAKEQFISTQITQTSSYSQNVYAYLYVPGQYFVKKFQYGRLYLSGKQCLRKNCSQIQNEKCIFVVLKTV